MDEQKKQHDSEAGLQEELRRESAEVSDAVGSPTWDHFHEETRSQAVFAHGIYDLSDYVDQMRS